MAGEFLLAGIFADVEARLPNLVIARLTRASVGRALDVGVTASLIRRFVESRAHPRMLHNGHGMPDNVRDQLFLWDKVRWHQSTRPSKAVHSDKGWFDTWQERNRMLVDPGFTISGFESPAEFDAVLGYLRDVKGVLALDERRRVIVVPESVFAGVRAFMARWRSETPA